MTVDEPIFSLLSLESEEPRVRLLKRGSLAECAAELVDVMLHDALACNPARLEIVVTDPDGGPGATHTLFRIASTGDGI